MLILIVEVKTMIKKRLKDAMVPGMYLIVIALFIVCLFMINDVVKGFILKDNSGGKMVDDEIVNTDNSYIPVVASDPEIIKPFMNEGVSVYKDFYDYKGESSGQEKAIIYYGNKYIQNSGIDYKGDASFDVISILDGTVTRVEENEMLGTTVEIRHSADIVSVYQGVSDVSVKKDEVVKQGQKIAVSGKSKIYSDVENGLHFEISHNGMIVNPSEYFNKTLKDL